MTATATPVVVTILLSIHFTAGEHCKWHALLEELECWNQTNPGFPDLRSVPELNDTSKVAHLVMKNHMGLVNITKSMVESSYKNLEIIHIENSNLEFIEPYTFVPLEFLEAIELSKNEKYKHPFWMSFATHSQFFHKLNLREMSSFECSCNLKWLYSRQEIQNEIHHVKVPHSNGLDLHISNWDYYYLPQRVEPPKVCVEHSKKIELDKYFQSSLGAACASKVGKMSLTIANASGIASHGIPTFTVGSTAIIECSITTKLSRISVPFLDLRLPAGEVHNKVTVIKNTSKLIKVNISNLEITDNDWLVCRISSKTKVLTPQPLIELKPLLVIGPPKVLSMQKTIITGGGRNWCIYKIACFPNNNLAISWFVNNTIPIEERFPKLASTGSTLNEYAIHPSPEHSPYTYWLKQGHLSLSKLDYLQGNYTLKACNEFGHNPWILPLSIAAGCLFLVVAIIMVVCCFKAWLSKDTFLSGCQKQSYISNSSGAFPAMEMVPLNSLTNVSENYAYSPSGILNFSPDVPLIATDNSLEIKMELGEGAFGKVLLAECDAEKLPKPLESARAGCSSGKVLVAAKKLKIFSADRLNSLRIEATNLARLKHPNIVEFYGVCLTSEEERAVYLLFEYMELGNLRSYLIEHNLPLSAMQSLKSSCSLGDTSESSTSALVKRKRSSTRTEVFLSPKETVDFCLQIARGMAFLADNHFVHRDLAARNCLLSAGPISIVVKISDFGMSRDIYCGDYYRFEGNRLLPVRWLAPEALLYGKSCLASDVWSMGVTFWEILTMGKQPWYSFGNQEVMEKVRNGETLEVPDTCPEDLKGIVTSCWTFQLDLRPTASEIAEKLHKIYHKL